MYWNLYLYEKFVNTIYASEEFVRKYCEENNLTYELRPDPIDTDEPMEKSIWEQLDEAYRQGVDAV